MSAKAVVFDTGHTEIIHDAQLDYYGKRLATASSDHSIRIFDIAADKQTLLTTITAHDGPVYQVSWAHPKYGSILASASYDGRVLIFKETAHNQWTRLYEHFKAESAINSVQFAPHTHGLVLAVGAADGTVVILTRLSNNTWDVQSFVAHKGGVNAVSWGPDIRPTALNAPPQSVTALRIDRRLVTAGCDCAIRVWRNSSADGDAASPSQSSSWIDTQSIPLNPLPHSDWVRDVAWSPSIGQSASHIAAASTDRTVSLWAETAESQFRRVETLKFDQPVWRVSWSLMGGMLAVSEGDGKVSLWKETNDGQWKQISQEQAPPQ